MYQKEKKKNLASECQMKSQSNCMYTLNAPTYYIHKSDHHNYYFLKRKNNITSGHFSQIKNKTLNYVVMY